MKIYPLLLLTMLVTAIVQAQSPARSPQLNKLLRRLDVDASVESLQPAPFPGFLEIDRGMQVLYVSADGSVLIDGDILSVTSGVNLTERRRADIRRKMLAEFPEEETLVLHAGSPTTARLVVFTDTNCPYCMQFHRQHEEFLHRGIEIQYFFYPRSGPSSESWSQAESVWCAPDRRQAMNAVMNGNSVHATSCRNPVAAQYDLAKRLQLKGTPAIITPDGAVHYGMTSSAEIIAAVELSRHVTDRRQ